MCYVSDASGFALIWLVNGIKLRVLCYDFDQKFCTKIKYEFRIIFTTKR